MTNLLQNPGFEGGDWRRTYTGVEYGEISVPQGWVAFWKEGGPIPHDPANRDGYRRPECKVIGAVPPFLDPPRVHEGEQAWQCFTFFGIHDAGLYQQVEGVEPGTRLRASAWAHAWSSRDDRADTSDTEGGGKYNFTFRVGIDPWGETDPWSPRVVWSEPVNYYDEYQKIPPVEALAASDAVTVFLRSQVMWRFKHCDAYWDAASLTVVEEPEPEPITPEGVEVRPSHPITRRLFRVVAPGAAASPEASLHFAGGEVLQGPPHPEGEDLFWRCIALGVGEHAVSLRVEGEEVARANFQVRRKHTLIGGPGRRPPVPS
jgi:hypothetical protein